MSIRHPGKQWEKDLLNVQASVTPLPSCHHLLQGYVCSFLWPRKLRYQYHGSSVRPFNRQTLSSYLVSTRIWHMQVWQHMKLVKLITQLLQLLSVQTVLFKEKDGRTKVWGLQTSWSHNHTLVFLIKVFAWKSFYFVLHLKIIFHGLYFFSILRFWKIDSSFSECQGENSKIK